MFTVVHSLLKVTHLFKVPIATVKALPHPDRNEFVGLLKVRFLLNRISHP